MIFKPSGAQNDKRAEYLRLKRRLLELEDGSIELTDEAVQAAGDALSNAPLTDYNGLGRLALEAALPYLRVRP